MKLTEIFQSGKATLSFEVFPPKTSTSFESVKAATEKIAKLHPSFVSVTYGAGGGTSRYTMQIAQNMKQVFNVPTMAHLTCVSSTRKTVQQKIRALQAAGLHRFVMLFSTETAQEAEGVIAAARAGRSLACAVRRFPSEKIK